ncbi:hypothetical protein NL676_034850 [Syzygium grande]|nr:hypothetical protein NL676_034850 [Syzygium grande]
MAKTLPTCRYPSPSFTVPLFTLSPECTLIATGMKHELVLDPIIELEFDATALFELDDVVDLGLSAGIRIWGLSLTQ